MANSKAIMRELQKIGKSSPGKVFKLTASSRARLEELGYDPLHQLVGLVEYLQGRLLEEESKTNPSAMVLSSLYTNLRGAVEKLLLYGYAAPKEGEEHKEGRSSVRILFDPELLKRSTHSNEQNNHTTTVEDQANER